MKSKKRVSLLPYFLVLPGILLLVIVIFLPFLQNIYYSFTDYSLLNKNVTFIGLENYKEVLLGRNFFPSLRKTLIWVVLNMGLLTVFGLTAAFALNSSTLKGSKVLQAFLLIPWIMPEVVTGYTWKLLLNYQTGPYYQILEALRIIPQGEDIFSSNVYAMLAVAFANSWRSFPIVAITVFAKLQTQSKEQIEAAVIDGASRFVVFRDIELPHIGSTIAAVMTLCFVWTFNAFGIIHVMTGGGPAGATEVLPIYLQRTAFQFYNYAYSSAFAVLMILVLVMVIAMMYLAPFLTKRAADKQREGGVR